MAICFEPRLSQAVYPFYKRSARWHFDIEMTRVQTGLVAHHPFRLPARQAGHPEQVGVPVPGTFRNYHKEQNPLASDFKCTARGGN